MADLPAGWTTSALGDVAEVVSGATPKTGVARYWDGTIAWATPKDLSGLTGRILRTTERSITQTGLESCAARVLPAGSVLLSSRAPIGLVAISTIPVATNQGFKNLIPGGHLDAAYLAWWLKANRATLESRGNGATFKEISKRTVAEFPLPLPPIEEQRRIAGILDHVDDLRAKRRDSIARLDSLAAAQFVRNFGSPLDPANRTPRSPISELGVVTTGNSPSRDDASNFGGDLEWIKTDNIVPDQLRPSPAAEHLSATGSTRARTAPPGSLLVACIAGSSTSIGKVALTDRRVAFNQQINALTVNAENDPWFLYAQLNTWPELVRRKSTGGMKGLVSKSAFQSVTVLAPTRAEQQSFSEQTRAIEGQKERHRAQLAELDRLFASLQARAFRGEL